MKAFKSSGICAVLIAVCFASTAALAGQMSPPRTLPLPFDWYPESVAVGPDGAFYVSSWHQGAVVRLRPGHWQQPRLLVEPGSNGLANGQGVLVDAEAGLLWVCSGDMGFTTVPTTPSALKSYDLQTGEPRGSYPMPDDGYCNDIAQDTDGSLYVTDSNNPRILRLAAGDNALHVWKQGPALSAGKGQSRFLNGITITRHGMVYVSTVQDAPYLLRVPIRADGSAGPVTRVAMPRPLNNADAIRSIGPNRLLIFECNAFGPGGPYGGRISIATIRDDHAVSLTAIATGLNNPSSGVVVGHRVYFIQSKYAILTSRKEDASPMPENVPFAIQSVVLLGGTTHETGTHHG